MFHPCLAINQLFSSQPIRRHLTALTAPTSVSVICSSFRATAHFCLFTCHLYGFPVRVLLRLSSCLSSVWLSIKLLPGCCRGPPVTGLHIIHRTLIIHHVTPVVDALCNTQDSVCTTCAHRSPPPGHVHTRASHTTTRNPRDHLHSKYLKDDCSACN